MVCWICHVACCLHMISFLVLVLALEITSAAFCDIRQARYTWIDQFKNLRKNSLNGSISWSGVNVSRVTEFPNSEVSISLDLKKTPRYYVQRLHPKGDCFNGTAMTRLKIDSRLKGAQAAASYVVGIVLLKPDCKTTLKTVYYGVNLKANGQFQTSELNLTNIPSTERRYMASIIIGNFQTTQTKPPTFLFSNLAFLSCDYFLRYVKKNPRAPLYLGSTFESWNDIFACTGRVNGTMYFGFILQYVPCGGGCSRPAINSIPSNYSSLNALSNPMSSPFSSCSIGLRGQQFAYDWYYLDLIMPLSYDTKLTNPISISKMSNGSQIVLCTMYYDFGDDRWLGGTYGGWTLDTPGSPCHIAHQGMNVTSASVGVPFRYINLLPISY